MAKKSPEPPGPSGPVKRDIATRWTPELSKDGWTPVVDTFLDLYGLLELNSGQAMFVIHLMRFKWDERMPYPSATTIAQKMNVSHISVRNYARDLEERGLIKRKCRKGRTTQYDLGPLFARLERTKAEVEQQRTTNPDKAKAYTKKTASRPIMVEKQPREETENTLELSPEDQMRMLLGLSSNQLSAVRERAIQDTKGPLVERLVMLNLNNGLDAGLSALQTSSRNMVRLTLFRSLLKMQLEVAQ